MRYFDTFSGIGGFTHGIERAFNNKYERQGGDSSSTSPNKRNDNSNEYEQKCSRPTCIGFSEIDKYAKAIYQYHYPTHKDYGDITAINESELPDFDLFVGGFPCQAFSIAGKRQGFNDTRGTLFFDVARILKAKQPEWVLLENVKGLCSHDDGKTLATIYGVLTELGYTVGWEVVNSCQFGVPQNRERIFIVGHLTTAGGCAGEILPVSEKDSGLNERAKQAPIARCFTAGGNSGGMHSSMTLVKSGTWRTHKDGEGFCEVESGLSPTIPARAREDGSGQPVIVDTRQMTRESDPRLYNESPTLNASMHKDMYKVQHQEKIRRLTPIECERLQGFPDKWTQCGIMDGEKVEISDTQRYKSLGNAVTVNVIEAIMYRIFNH